MKQPSKTRRRLLISIGLLGVAGVFYQPVYRYLEVHRMIREWEEKWEKTPASGAEADSTPPPGNARRLPARIENDLTLKPGDSPWVVDANLTIAAGVTLTLEAGCEILIGRDIYLTVEGCILAKGEAGNPVSLRAYSRAEADKWAGMLIIDSEMPSLFQHVAFENSYYGARVVHAAALWKECKFRNVREVCSGYKSETGFYNCLVEYKDFPGGGNINVFKFHKGLARMEDCSIHCPDSDYKVDGIDADYLVEGIFRGNRMYGGICPGADAIDTGRGSRNILVENNVITDFVDKGISVGEKAEVTVNNNIISGCAMGIGVKDSARAKVSRSTFYGNDYAIECYEKVAGQGGGHAELEDCLIATCKVTPYKVGDDSSIRFTGTLCDQQLLPGEANLQGTPVFEDAANKRFNCTRITLADGSSADCRQFGARIDPYPGS